MKYRFPIQCCLIIAVSVLLPMHTSAQLDKLQESKAHLSPQATPISSFESTAPTSRSNTLVLFEDFESINYPDLPAGWDGGEPVEQQQDNNNEIGLGTFVDAWQTGAATEVNYGGYFPVPHIPGNHFAYANDDDDPCNCDMMDVGLTTPEMDFTDLENMVVSFDYYSQAVFGGDNISLQFSTDGEEFVTIYTSESSPEWQSAYLDISYLDNQPSVWLRFAWSDNGFWSAGVAVDNVLVTENLDYNVGIIRAHTAQFDADWDDPEVISGEYSQIPLEQAAPIKVGAHIMNKGALAISNVVLSVSIYFDDQLLGSYNSQVIENMQPLDEQHVYILTDLIPEEVGEYHIEYELIAADDEDLEDNSAGRNIIYSQDVYAMDDDVADSFRNNGDDSFAIGNVFEITEEGSVCYSIGVGVGAGSQTGSEIYARIYDNNNLFITGSEPYVIQSADINQTGENKIVNIPLTTPLSLEAGTEYLAVVTYFDSPFWQFAVANSGSSQEQFSVFQDETGVWFYVTTTPMVRMNLSSTVSVQELNNIETLNVFPNPADDRIQLTLPKGWAGLFDLNISDHSGRLVHQESLNTTNEGGLSSTISTAHLASGNYLITVRSRDQIAQSRFVVIR